ncbi:sensor histidine kinase [Agromyces sp. CFH 90414]|uniref:histidine kinase n=1 Tax=Agromyces agglutinans TaxID=2662258 RepID=A0A6I2F4K4_9MICO|nr:histidine kinase [Agromyces agglutinans]MRG59519.1 sensor histidine kinase [Agromyces agglutinans]
MVNRRWWDVVALAVVAVTVLFSVLQPPYAAAETGSWAMAGVFLIVYVAYLRGRLGLEDPRHHVAITAVLAVIIAVGIGFDAQFANMLAFAYPYVWITAASTRQAIWGNIAIAGAVLVGTIVFFGWSDLGAALGISAISLGFSLALGLWISHIAGIGEENARLLAELRATQGELAAMHRDAGALQERGRLAREIHDTIAQSLTGLVMVAQRAGNRLAPAVGEPDAADLVAARVDVELIEEMARDALTEARGLVAAFTPVAMETNLADALGRLAATFERETGVQVDVRADASGLGRELEVVLLRSAQEGLANVRKHAGAAHAWIRVEADAAGRNGASGASRDLVRLVVRDDGTGPREAAGARGGFGLAGIRDRVALVGGRVAFGAAPGGGAVLEVEVPVEPHAEGATE